MAYTSQLNAVLGGSIANAYITVAECDAILGKRTGCSGWANFGKGLSTDDTTELKERLIITASKQIDGASNWAGQKFFYPGWDRLSYPLAGQPMEFPRAGFNNSDLDHDYLTETADSGSTTTFVSGTLASSNGYRADELNGGSLITYNGTNADAHVVIADFADEVITVTTQGSAYDTTSKAYILYPFKDDFKLAVALQVWELYQENPEHSDRLGGGLEKLIEAGAESVSTPDGISVSMDLSKYKGNISIAAESMVLLRQYSANTRKQIRYGRG